MDRNPVSAYIHHKLSHAVEIWKGSFAQGSSITSRSVLELLQCLVWRLKSLIEPPAFSSITLASWLAWSVEMAVVLSLDLRRIRSKYSLISPSKWLAVFHRRFWLEINKGEGTAFQFKRSRGYESCNILFILVPLYISGNLGEKC